jgi:hypothetical protein
MHCVVRGDIDIDAQTQRRGHDDVIGAPGLR